MKITEIGALLLLLLMSATVDAKSDKTIIRSVSTAHVKFLRKVDRKYQKSHGIKIRLKKKVVQEVLGTEKTSSGEAWLNKGKMRLEIKKPEPSQIIADGTYLWMVTPPPPEFEGIKTQVIKASLQSKRAKSQGLIQLLTGGGLLKYFKVVGIKKEGEKILYFLQPERQSQEFKRANVAINKNKKEIVELRYWDHLDNETFFTFEETKFNQTLEKSLFSYTPPKDAEIVTY